jgi:hypothetical protein
VTVTHESFAPASEQNVTYITGETTVVDFQLADILGPAITNTTFYVSTGDTLGPYVIETNITDYSPIAGVHFYYTSSTQGGPFELPLQLIDAGTGLYRIEIPGQPLGSSIQYWLTASDIAGNETSDPPGAPWENYRFAVADIVTIFTDDLESDLGWTVGDTYDNATSGIWERVDPNGVWEDDILVQPEDDATPDPGVMCYITGNDPPGSPQGTDDVDIGKTTLFSPWFDLSVNNDVMVSYKRWFTHDTGFVIEQEYWIVQVTNNGVDWVDLENTNVSERSWLPLSFLIDDYVDPNSSVRFRFIANDTQFDSVVEAGVDDFQLTGHTLVADAAAPAVAVLSPNGGENIFGGDNTFSIAWDASDDIGVVMVAILLSTDGGQSWSDSLAGGPLSSPWEWQVPAINWQTCRIRIDCWDAVQNLSTDVSDADFVIQTAVSVDDLPVARVALHQNRPNPFNPRTEIRFALPAAQEISLKVYDLEGRLVRILADGWQEAGEHTLYWQGENNHGERVASGIYFYRLITADRTITRKMALLK